jgi:serine/threonine-protein kinase
MREELVRAARQLPPAPGVAEVAAGVPAQQAVPPDRATTVTIPRARSPRARRLRRLRILAVLAAVLAVLGPGAWAAWAYLVPHYTSVPGVVGLPVDRATARLEAAGLSFRIGPQVFSSTLEAGLVVRTRPPPGTRVRTRTEILLVTSKGPELLPVPGVVGRREAAARQAVAGAGFVPLVRLEYHDTVPAGRVIAQSPEEGQKVERGETVVITVSRGPPPVEVPGVAGRPADDAQATLEALGFTVRRTQQYSTVVPRGQVISTDPAGGELAPRGSRVTMVVSLGPRTFPMPRVVEMVRGEAVALLEGMGLVVRVVPVPSDNPPDTVVFQQPQPGTTVQQGQTVEIFVTGS